MQTIVDLLGTSWFSSMLGIVGIVLAIVFFMRSQNRRAVLFEHRSIVVLGDKGTLPPSVQVTYNGKPVPRVWRSWFAIWNAGNTTIDGDAIVPADPFRIQLEGPDAEVLSVDVERTTRSVTAFQAKATGTDNIILTFDFLDPGDGVLVSILHSGGMPKLLGTVKGLPNGLTDRGEIQLRNWPETAFGAVGFLVLAFFAWLILAVVLQAGLHFTAQHAASWSLISVGILVLAPASAYVFGSRCPASLLKETSVPYTGGGCG